jgi:histidyl-tRNA synthetase
MRRADKLSARHVLILGENEVNAGKGTVRDMQTKTDRPMAVDLTLPAQALINAIRDVNN